MSTVGAFLRFPRHANDTLALPLMESGATSRKCTSALFFANPHIKRDTKVLSLTDKPIVNALNS